VVGAVEPVLARRVEHIDVERVLESFGLVRHVGRDDQHLACAHDDLLGLVFADPELQRALEDVGQLLVLVRAAGDDGALAR
jgi:hypothetical protein